MVKSGVFWPGFLRKIQIIKLNKPFYFNINAFFSFKIIFVNKVNSLLKLKITLLLLRDLHLSNLETCSLLTETSQFACVANGLTGFYDVVNNGLI